MPVLDLHGNCQCLRNIRLSNLPWEFSVVWSCLVADSTYSLWQSMKKMQLSRTSLSSRHRPTTTLPLLRITQQLSLPTNGRSDWWPGIVSERTRYGQKGHSSLQATLTALVSSYLLCVEHPARLRILVECTLLALRWREPSKLGFQLETSGLERLDTLVRSRSADFGLMGHSFLIPNGDQFYRATRASWRMPPKRITQT